MGYWDNFIKNIKYLRTLNGYTQEQVAKKMGITRTKYRYIEAQQYEHSFLNILFQICTVYGVTPNELLLGNLQLNNEQTTVAERNERIKNLTAELEEMKNKIKSFEEKLMEL